VTDDPVLWVLAVLMIGTAIGIGAFWATWLRTEHTEPWLPPGYDEHERPFVVPDSVLAVLLVVSAVLLLLEMEAGRTLGLVAAGMLTFLGLLDATYFARTRMFAREHGGLANASLVLGVLALAGVLLAVLW
jgi:hypothetical protein